MESASAAAHDLHASGQLPKQLVPIHLDWEDLSFSIGASAVLRDLSGHLAHGELVALMGESGSGKSTLLNVLGGRASYGQTSGRLELNSRAFRPQELRHCIGYVPQSYILFEELTVFESLELAARLRAPSGETAAHRRRRIFGLLGLLGLHEVRHFVLDRHLSEGRLSGGQVRSPPPPPLNPRLL